MKRFEIIGVITAVLLVVSLGLVVNARMSNSGVLVPTGTVVDNTIPRFDGTTGFLIQTSGITINDSDQLGIATTSPAKDVDVGAGTATSTVVVRGGASVGGELIIASSDGANCVSITVKSVTAIGSTPDVSSLLFAEVIACP